MPQNKTVRQLMSLAKGVSFLQEEAINLGCAIHSPELKPSQKLGMIVDYLTLTNRLCDELGNELHQAIEAVQHCMKKENSNDSNRYEFTEDYDLIDKVLQEYVDEKHSNEK
ncbi:hypothetical protein [Chrysiogenes arsenatis]|uniref:hypothetical protein n=1 Tax=Chrysiogenes arsenatis TaxID=309797 RepID=UPI000403E35E|nr:hypothetical protein [Chrysiogenes arsenatis]